MLPFPDPRAHLKEVLIVEDDPALARFAARVVEGAGYASCHVLDGRAALETVRRAAPRLVLLDLVLPGLDGVELITCLRRTPGTAEVPIVAMSGVLRRATHDAELRRAGACAFLEKPFTAQALLESVEAAIGLARGTQLAGETVRASLDAWPLTEVLRDAAERRFGGTLRLTCGRAEKVLLLEDGRPVALRSNLRRDTLRAVLLEAGRIDGRKAEALERRARAGELVEQALALEVEMPGSEIRRWTEAAGEAALLELFAWREGSVHERPGVRDLACAFPLAGDSRTWLARGVERMDPAVIARQLARYRECDVVPVNGAEGERLGVLPASVASLLESAPRDLYTAWCTGQVQLVRATGEAATPAGGVSGQVERMLAARREDQERKNLFEVLALPPGAAPADVSRAFVRLANEFHPDRFASTSHHTQMLAAQVFARACRAHEVLSDPHGRTAYEAVINEFSLDDTGVSLTRVACARADFQRGEEALAQGAFEDALGHMERALAGDPMNGAYRAARLWARFQLAPDVVGRRRIASQLEAVLGAGGRSAQGEHYLGQMRRTLGLDGRTR